MGKQTAMIPAEWRKTGMNKICRARPTSADSVSTDVSRGSGSGASEGPIDMRVTAQDKMALRAPPGLEEVLAEGHEDDPWLEWIFEQPFSKALVGNLNVAPSGEQRGSSAAPGHGTTEAPQHQQKKQHVTTAPKPSVVGGSFVGGTCTYEWTVMVRGVPSRCTRDRFVETLQQRWGGLFNFVWLPMGSHTWDNPGYAFIGFVSMKAMLSFQMAYQKKPASELVPRASSQKVLDVTLVGSQGLVDRLHKRGFEKMIANPDWLPAVIDNSGRILAHTRESLLEAFPGIGQ